MNVWFQRLARIGAVLALAVVMLGACVRLSDAGLGCPDWPGCYGRLVVPHQATSAEELGIAYTRPLEAGKAWREMIHRYLASRSALCLALAAIAWRNRRDPAQPKRRRSALVALIVFQGLLGMWTVTLLLKPLFVVAHLLGGLTTLALLAWLGLALDAVRHRPRPRCARSGWPQPPHSCCRSRSAAGRARTTRRSPARTSRPARRNGGPPSPTSRTAFVLWRGLGIDYEGGVLDHPARVAIHFTHRLGAVLAAVLLALLGVRGWRAKPPRGPTALAVSAVLALSCCLGVSIVWFGVPLGVAVLHNGVAALLLFGRDQC